MRYSTQFCLERGLPFVAVFRDAPQDPGYRVRVDAGATTPTARACPLLHTRARVCRVLGPCGCCVRVVLGPSGSSSYGGGWTLQGGEVSVLVAPVLVPQGPCWTLDAS